MKRRVGRAVAAAAIGLALLGIPIALLQVPAVRSVLVAGIAFIRDTGPLGVAAYYGAYALGVVVTGPPWLFSAIAGYAYGFGHGVAVASSANLAATTSAFLLGRFALARRLDPWLGKSPRVAAVRRAVESDALRIALLIRISPLIPQNLMNYAFSVTRMPLLTFMGATWLGLLPITTFQVYVGSLVHEAAELLEGKGADLGPWRWVVTGAGVAVTVAVIVLLARFTRKALERHGVLASVVPEADG